MIKELMIPSLLSSTYYFTLALFWLLFLRKLNFPKIHFLFITLFHTQANFLNIYAFSKINFNYSFTINISSVIWTCIFTCIFIRRYKYTKFHILGVVLTLVGLGIAIYGRFEKNDDLNILLKNVEGTLYCLAASLCFSM
jgi:drug/metabolite transporter (DMT)-like permease